MKLVIQNEPELCPKRSSAYSIIPCVLGSLATYLTGISKSSEATSLSGAFTLKPDRLCYLDPLRNITTSAENTRQHVRSLLGETGPNSKLWRTTSIDVQCAHLVQVFVVQLPSFVATEKQSLTAEIYKIRTNCRTELICKYKPTYENFIDSLSINKPFTLFELQIIASDPCNPLQLRIKSECGDILIGSNDRQAINIRHIFDPNGGKIGHFKPIIESQDGTEIEIEDIENMGNACGAESVIFILRYKEGIRGGKTFNQAIDEAREFLKDNLEIRNQVFDRMRTIAIDSLKLEILYYTREHEKSIITGGLFRITDEKGERFKLEQTDITEMNKAMEQSERGHILRDGLDPVVFFLDSVPDSAIDDGEAEMETQQAHHILPNNVIKHIYKSIGADQHKKEKNKIKMTLLEKYINQPPIATVLKNNWHILEPQLAKKVYGIAFVGYLLSAAYQHHPHNLIKGVRSAQRGHHEGFEEIDQNLLNCMTQEYRKHFIFPNSKPIDLSLFSPDDAAIYFEAYSSLEAPSQVKFVRDSKGMFTAASL